MVVCSHVDLLVVDVSNEVVLKDAVHVAVALHGRRWRITENVGGDHMPHATPRHPGGLGDALPPPPTPKGVVEHAQVDRGKEGRPKLVPIASTELETLVAAVGDLTVSERRVGAAKPHARRTRAHERTPDDCQAIGSVNGEKRLTREADGQIDDRDVGGGGELDEGTRISPSMIKSGSCTGAWA